MQPVGQGYKVRQILAVFKELLHDRAGQIDKIALRGGEHLRRWSIQAKIYSYLTVILWLEEGNLTQEFICKSDMMAFEIIALELMIKNSWWDMAKVKIKFHVNFWKPVCLTLRSDTILPYVYVIRKL